LIAGNTATITGKGKVNRKPGYTFRVTIVDGNPDEMGIEIYNPDGSLYYQDPPGGGTQALIRGNFTIGNSIYYYHNDHLGTPMLMTDESGQIVWEGEFLPFGETFSITGTITNNLRFPGQYYDEETDFNYNYYRNYNPRVGRYVEVDRQTLGSLIAMEVELFCELSEMAVIYYELLRNPQKQNLFVYAINNPINLVDPRGSLPETTGDWLKLISTLKKHVKVATACKDIEKYMNQNCLEECMECCMAISKISGGIMWHHWYTACNAILCL
jgi:RHS repeat-associated protein